MDAIIIKHAKPTIRWERVDKRTPEERKKAIDESNKKEFFAKYPDLREALIEDIV